jgi:hypothetical protein
MHGKINPNNLYITDNTTINNRKGENGGFTSNKDNEEVEEEESDIYWEKNML